MRAVAALDLSRYEDIRAHAVAIQARLATGSMPCDGRWPDDQVARFTAWLAGGMAP